MKVRIFIAACAAGILIAGIAVIVLEALQQPASLAFTTEAVRT
jgi:hypothetical protein